MAMKFIMSKHSTYQWIEKFKAGKSNMEDEPHSGRPSDLLNKESIQCVRNLLQEDPPVYCF